MMMARRTAMTIGWVLLLQYFGVALSEQTTVSTTSGNNGVHISGEMLVDGLAGPDGMVVVRFVETDFQGLTMEIQTGPSLNVTVAEGDGSLVPMSIPYQKVSGAIDCINQKLDEDIVIVSGTVQGTANDPIVDYRLFKEGDRFMTAVRGNHHQAGVKDQVGEISNFGAQESADLSDCMYFMASDFELREVAGGHITVY